MEKAVIDKIEAVIKEMPENFQDDTRKKVIEWVEKSAQERGDGIVLDEYLIQGFLKSVPSFAHGPIIKSMIRAGISESLIEAEKKGKSSDKAGKEKNSLRDLFAFKKIIRDYPHSAGINCVPASAVNILKYLRGLIISEDMIFGLGSGIYFDYYRNWKDQSPTQNHTIHISGMTFCIPHALEMLGIRYKLVNIQENGEVSETSDLETMTVRKVVKNVRKAMIDDMKRKLRANIPTLFIGDGFYLRVFPGHFGVHHSVIIGYNEARHIVYLGDATKEQIYEVSEDDFFKARNSKETFIPPFCTWFEYELPPVIEVAPEAVWNSISRNSDIMLGNIPQKKFEEHPTAKRILRGAGIKGMQVFADEIPEWPERMTEDEIREFATFININIDYAGAGATFFRKAYANFLREAAVLVKNDQLLSIADQFFAVGESWNALGKKFFEIRRIQTPENFQSARQMVLSIRDWELEAFSKLNELAKKNISDNKNRLLA